MRRLLGVFTLVVAVLLLVPPARVILQAAIAFDAVGSQGDQAGDLTWSHTTTGSNRVLIVTAGYQGTTTTATATFNGVSMTQLWSKRDDINLQGVFGWKLALEGVVATGAQTVVVDFTGAVDLSSGGSISFTGVDQTTVNRTVYTNNEIGGGTGGTVTVVDSQNGDMVVDGVISFSTAITVGTNQTSRVEDDGIAGGSSSFGTSTEAATGGNTVMNWTIVTGGEFWGIGATALIPSGGGAATPCSGLLLLGAGCD